MRAWDGHDECAAPCCAVLGSSSRILAKSAPGAGTIVAARLGTLPFHEDKVQLMSGAASRCPRRKKQKAREEARGKLGDACRLWSETWRIRRGGKGVGARKMARMDWLAGWLAERMGD